MLLDKKRGLLVLSSLFLALLIPVVSAQYEGVYSMFSFLFGAGDDGSLMLLKAGVWIILFAIIFWAAKKMFSGSKGIATIFSIVVSLISIRFIPDEYIYYIGSAYGVFGIIVLVLAIIGGTLLILNSYFPIKEHKAFGVVWALFYFFMAWVFHQIAGIITGISQVDELLPVMGPWGKWVCIVLGLACLLRAFSGTSSYARPNYPHQPQYEPEDRGGGEDKSSQQPTYVGGDRGKGGPTNINLSQSQKQKQKQKQEIIIKGGGGGETENAVSWVTVDGKPIKGGSYNAGELGNNNYSSIYIKNIGKGGKICWVANCAWGLSLSKNGKAASKRLKGCVEKGQIDNITVKLAVSSDQIRSTTRRVEIIKKAGSKHAHSIEQMRKRPRGSDFIHLIYYINKK